VICWHVLSPGPDEVGKRVVILVQIKIRPKINEKQNRIK